jgi:putative membrane protein
MPALADGVHRSAAGAATLAAKLPQLASGVQKVADGADELAGGASKAAAGADELAAGVGSLAGGSAKLGTGASDLSSGLGAGVSKIPTYSASERAALAAVATTPIVADVTRVNPVKNNGAGLAPLFMALALWVGSLAVYLLLRPLSPRALASGAPSALVALAGYLPGALLGAAQGVALALVLQWWIGIGAASTWGLVGVGALIGLTFAAFNQALVGLFGTAGRFVAVLLAGLQLAAAGGTYPVATAPGFFGVVHDALPLTYAVDALRRVIAGATDGIGRDVAVLVLTLVGSLLVTMYAAHRQRTWTVRRLRPVTVT